MFNLNILLDNKKVFEYLQLSILKRKYCANNLQLNYYLTIYIS